jgi:hypothetical protein
MAAFGGSISRRISTGSAKHSDMLDHYRRTWLWKWTFSHQNVWTVVCLFVLLHFRENSIKDIDVPTDILSLKDKSTFEF